MPARYAGKIALPRDPYETCTSSILSTLLLYGRLILLSEDISVLASSTPGSLSVEYTESVSLSFTAHSYQ